MLIYIMNGFCILTYGFILLAMPCGLIYLGGGKDHLERNISELPEEIGQLFKAYKSIN